VSQPTGSTPAARARPRPSLRTAIARFVSLYALLLLLVAMFGLFSLLRPNTFPTTFNITQLLNQQSVLVAIALAVMAPMAANQFNLSVGFHLGLGVLFLVGLQIKSGMSWELAVVIVVVLSMVLGVINGVLVAYAEIDSFIATLGTGTILQGIGLWYTSGQQISGTLSPTFTAISGSVLGVPAPALGVLVVAVALWIVYEYVPFGRFLYVIGANPRAAELTGIAVKRNIVLAFALSGLLVAVAAVILAAQLQVGQPSIGPDYLLPGFAGALLGATSVRPGRVNVWGTVLAVLLLAVLVSGLAQLGFDSWVQPVFNGIVLIVAVGLAVYGTRRRNARASVDAAAATLRGQIAPDLAPAPGDVAHESRTA
jgi:ribose transport system permease protein